MEKVRYNLKLTKLEEESLLKDLSKSEYYNTDLAIIGAVILEAKERGDLIKED